MEAEMRDTTDTDMAADAPGATTPATPLPEGAGIETAFARARLEERTRRARAHVIEASEAAYAHPAEPQGEPDKEIALWNAAGRYAGFALVWALMLTPVVALSVILLS
jgi:hypothetical protein